MTLGENIARLRTQKDWSQGDLADALGISRQSISKWETDTSIPELEKHRRRHPSGKSAIPSPEQLYCVPVRSFWFSGCCSPVIC